MNDLTITPTLPSQSGITPEERARRKAATDYARGSLRLEGLEISDNGEITRAEFTAATIAHHHP
jgi:hypothetical protein